MRHRLLISYRGDAYSGWQRQPNARTVQTTVEAALTELLREPVSVVGASRTDTGVHALGQVAHLDLSHPFSTRGLVFGTNHFLPRDVRILAAERVSDDFHARKSALAKTYRYRMSRAPVLSPLVAPFTVRVDPRLDVERIQEVSSELVGRHDFSAFAKSGGSHTQPFRTIFEAVWEERGPELDFRVSGSGFLRGMVRALVGTLLEVGRGTRTPQGFVRLLGGGERRSAGTNAPAHGLVLERVFYA